MQIIMVNKKQWGFRVSLEELRKPIVKEIIAQRLRNGERPDYARETQLDEDCLFQNLEHEAMSGV